MTTITDYMCDHAALQSSVDLLRIMQAQPHRSMEHNLWEAIKNYLERATPAPEPQPGVAAEPVAWGDAGTIGNLIAQLSTLDPTTPVYGAFHADYKGTHQCFVRGLTLSRERVVGRKIESGNAEVPYSAVIWSAPEANPSHPPPVVEEAVKAEREAILAIVDKELLRNRAGDVCIIDENASPSRIIAAIRARSATP